MFKRKVLFGTLLFCFGGLAAFGQDSPIKVTISSALTQVRNNEIVSVCTTLRNISSEEQVLEALSCGYSNQWIADNPSVLLLGDPCKKVGLMQIRLKPNETHERHLSIRVTLPASGSHPQSVTFRLGFQNERSRTEMKPPRIWSNAVTVNVTR